MGRSQVGVVAGSVSSPVRLGLFALLCAASAGTVAALADGATLIGALGWASGVGVGIAVGLLVAKRRPAIATVSSEDVTAARALAAAGDGYWDLDLRRGKVRYSDRCASMLGYGPEDVEDTLAFWGGLVHPDDLREARRMLDEHTAGKSDVYEVTVRLRDKDGAWRWILDRGRVVERGATGEAVRLVGVHRLLPAPPIETSQWLMQRVSEELEAILAVFLGRRELAAGSGAAPENPFVDEFDAAVDGALTLADSLSAYASPAGGPSHAKSVPLRQAIVAVADAHHLAVEIEGDDVTVAVDRRLLETGLAAVFNAVGARDTKVPIALAIAVREGRAIVTVRAIAGAAPERRWRWVVARVIAERHGGWATTRGDPRTPDEIEFALPVS